MAQKPSLTIVLGFRDRDILRVQRCLDSLAAQTVKDFTVIFVDYGSRREVAAAIQSVVERYDFCRYIYSDTRGYPWNRSRALNIGIRQAISTYVATSDVDMIYAANFCETVLQKAATNRILQCRWHRSPRNFTDWEHISRYAEKSRSWRKGGLGGFQCVATEVFHSIRGFDELYQYWGIEDQDLYDRLLLMELEEVWLTGETHLFHQWHPPATRNTPGFMPGGLYERMIFHFAEYHAQVIRNTEDWGRIHTTADRPIFRFLDFDQNVIRWGDDLKRVDVESAKLFSVVHALISFVQELSSGQAIAINNTTPPHSNRIIGGAIGYLNRAFPRLGFNINVGYTDHLRSLLTNLIISDQKVVADYYLNFPALQGVSILLKA